MNLNHSRLSNKSGRSFMDSFSSTKSWLAKQWSKTQRKKSKTKHQDSVEHAPDNNTLTTEKPVDFKTTETHVVQEHVISKDEVDNRLGAPPLLPTEETFRYRYTYIKQF